VLAGHYREEKRWYAFQDAQVKGRILDWLAPEGIEPIDSASPLTKEPGPVEPTACDRLLGGVLPFIRAASRLAGVIRIALVGSLTTEEPDPKDADLLVTVTGKTELDPLATLGRKLQGHAQSFARGGEVLLADPEGHYLGRTCPWTRCSPGVRGSCDALHCGWRLYLHDDLETVRLDESLIIAPPIELWPRS
jgi:hypothetical protein